MPSSKTAFFTGILLFLILVLTGRAHEDFALRHRHNIHHTSIPDADVSTVTAAPKPGEFPPIVEVSSGAGRTTSGRPRPRPPMPIPGPPRPENSLAPEGPSLLEKFVAVSAPKARHSEGPPTSSPVNQRGVVDKAVWLFVAAVGFFVVSLVVNLYTQVGLNREKAMATNGNPDMEGRMENMGPGGLGDEKAHGQGKWLLQDSVAPVPVSAV
ncbi:hypothetical protein H2200_004729 [Cladophialophora chaetospira]|uniref:Uncharacterized protein n=1 Tax=Cladophialophora chaetospira TaxID=386627 RepID=A0AA38XDU8_9EURO|nr:hypothetical protein H2200_004729 [Cladophialophora chaetospira]